MIWLSIELELWNTQLLKLLDIKVIFYWIPSIRKLFIIAVIELWNNSLLKYEIYSWWRNTNQI